MKLHCVNSKQSLSLSLHPQKNPGIINDPCVRDGLAVSRTTGVYFMFLFFILGPSRGYRLLATWDVYPTFSSLFSAFVKVFKVV